MRPALGQRTADARRRGQEFGRIMIRKTKRRDPERTKDMILQAAVSEFSGKGLGGARVDAIAKRARVNKRMLYHYFGNKSQRFVAVLEHMYDEIRTKESALHLEKLDPIEGMKRLIEFSFDYYIDHPHFIPLLNSENLHRASHLKRSSSVRKMHSPLIAMIQGLLTRGVEQGVFRECVDPVQLYISIAGLGYFYFSNMHTLSTIFGKDLSSPKRREARRRHIAELALGYLRP
jgi:AcrR family transcriptional regulator